MSVRWFSDVSALLSDTYMTRHYHSLPRVHYELGGRLSHPTQNYESPHLPAMHACFESSLCGFAGGCVRKPHSFVNKMGWMQHFRRDSRKQGSLHSTV